MDKKVKRKNKNSLVKLMLSVWTSMYEPFETSECEKCGKIIAESKELM